MMLTSAGIFLRGFPEFADQASWPCRYEGFSGEPVYDAEDPLAENPLGFLLPASHPRSIFHDNCRCYYCEETVDRDQGPLVREHIVPFSKGGADRELLGEDNFTSACDSCNRKKWDNLGWMTVDGRYGYFWDGTPGNSSAPPSMPVRAKRWSKRSKPKEDRQ